jgi:hypothetical protein
VVVEDAIGQRLEGDNITRSQKIHVNIALDVAMIWSTARDEEG